MRHRALAALALASLAVASLAAPVVAGPPARMAVCHYNAVTDAFTRIMVMPNAVSAHLRHGDGLPGEGDLDANCQLVVAPPRAFIQAFRNVDGQPGYNATTDFLYNELIDTNRNDTPDAGDTVHVYAFPTDFVGGTMSVGVSQHVVTSVNVLSPVTILVEAGGFNFNWTTNSGGAFIEIGPVEFSTMGDGSGDSSATDLIRTRVESPSAPASVVEVTIPSTTDDPWLDVTLTP